MPEPLSEMIKRSQREQRLWVLFNIYDAFAVLMGVLGLFRLAEGMPLLRRPYHDPNLLAQGVVMVTFAVAILYVINTERRKS